MLIIYDHLRCLFVPCTLFSDAATDYHAKSVGLKLGDPFPDFEADSSIGKINWHEYIDGSWAVLFSHPGAFIHATVHSGACFRAQRENVTSAVGRRPSAHQQHCSLLTCLQCLNSVQSGYPALRYWQSRCHALPSLAGIFASHFTTSFLGSNHMEWRA